VRIKAQERDNGLQFNDKFLQQSTKQCIKLH